MIDLPVLNVRGEKVETLEVDERLLGGKVRPTLMRQAVISYQANRRVGTAYSRTRGEVAGSTGKLYRQKGTGHARAGSRKAPQRVGGGKAHGPRPRDLSKRLSRKARRQALRSAILSRISDGETAVLDHLELAEPKTKVIAELLAQLGIEGSCLIVTANYDQVVLKSARNLPGISVLPVSGLNAYEVLLPKRVLLTRESLERLLGEERE